MSGNPRKILKKLLYPISIIVRKILLVFLSLLFPLIGETNVTKPKENRSIRRLYLEVLQVPPTPQELEWFLVYNSNAPYRAALEQLNIRDPLKIDYYERELKERDPHKLTNSILEKIIKYQSGNFNSPLEECKKKIIKDSIAVARESDPLEGFDYMSECLTGRTLSTEESNLLIKEYRKYPSTEEGFSIVLDKIIEFRDYLFD